MYDLHTHTTMTDGEMIPIELVRRMSVLGYRVIAITDHADSSNLGFILSSLARVGEDAEDYGIQVLRGVELTHVPPRRIPVVAREARSLGAEVVLVHGETPLEPVAPGTNHAACGCPDVDVLAHPGLITPDNARLAREHGVALEITSRGGHNRANGHVARVGIDAGCQLVVDSDAHAPGDLLDEHAKRMVALGAGLPEKECARVLSLNIQEWLSRAR
jgi:histidinol phosphatase-like PHP family hydrolase